MSNDLTAFLKQQKDVVLLNKGYFKNFAHAHVQALIKLSKLSAELTMAEVTANNVWLLSVALILIPLTGKDGIPHTVIIHKLYLLPVITHNIVSSRQRCNAHGSHSA